jgi:transposase
VQGHQYRFEIDIPEAEFTTEYDDTGLQVKKISVKPDKTILARRKSIVEHPFGTIKRAMQSDHCLMKRLPNVMGEFALSFLAYNMKRAINIMGSEKMVEILQA